MTFKRLKTELRASGLPKMVQRKILAEATEALESKGGEENDVALKTVQRYHDLVSGDLESVRRARLESNRAR